MKTVKKPCINCVYFATCGSTTRTEQCNGRQTKSDKMRINEQQAKEFYRDLCGTVYGDANKNSQGIMSIGLIAEHMCISIEKANDFCQAMINYGITERQNGMIVV